MFLLSFQPQGSFTLATYYEVLSARGVRTGISNTMGIALLSTALAMCVGLFEAWLIAYSDVRGKLALQIFFMLPLTASPKFSLLFSLPF